MIARLPDRLMSPFHMITGAVDHVFLAIEAIFGDLMETSHLRVITF